MHGTVGAYELHTTTVADGIRETGDDRWRGVEEGDRTGEEVVVEGGIGMKTTADPET